MTISRAGGRVGPFFYKSSKTPICWPAGCCRNNCNVTATLQSQAFLQNLIQNCWNIWHKFCLSFLVFFRKALIFRKIKNWFETSSQQVFFPISKKSKYLRSFSKMFSDFREILMLVAVNYDKVYRIQTPSDFGIP